MNNIIKSMDVGDIIACVACFISIICTIITFFQLRIAKKEYKLQKKIYTDGIPKLELSISDNFIYDDMNRDNIYFFFGIFVSNLSDKQTSIKKVILSLMCEDDLIYKPQLTRETLDLYKDLNIINNAQNIEAHSSIAGWCVFSLPRDVYKKINIDTYFITIEDIHNVIVKGYSVLLREELINYEIG